MHEPILVQVRGDHSERELREDRYQYPRLIPTPVRDQSRFPPVTRTVLGGRGLGERGSKNDKGESAGCSLITTSAACSNPKLRLAYCSGARYVQ